MKLAGPRPDTVPVHQGEFEMERIYLAGDEVTWKGKTYCAQRDFRSGFLEPPVVIQDTGSFYWTEK